MNTTIYEKYSSRTNDLLNGVIPFEDKELNHYLENAKSKYDLLNNYYFYKDLMTYEDFRKILNDKSNKSKKRNRCKKNLDLIMEMKTYKLSNDWKCVFGTITLSNDYFNLSAENQKKVIQRYLKKHYAYVIKNKDYCPTSNRLHYHFIGLTNENIIPINRKSKKGNALYTLENDDFKYCLKDKNKDFTPKLEMVELSHKSLSNYLVKLNNMELINHSIKDSTNHSKLSILKNDKLLQININKMDLF
jgi:hypothetical protein